MRRFLEETGEVVETGGDSAKVLLHRHSSCDKCGACGMGGKQQIVVEATNGIGAKPGDKVILQIQSGYLFKAAFLMYTVPLLMLILGFLAGQQISIYLGSKADTAENIGIFSGFIVLAFSYLTIRWWDRKSQLGKKLRPSLIGVTETPHFFSGDRQK